MTKGGRQPRDTRDHRTEPLVSPEVVARWLEVIPQPIAVTGGTGFVGSHLVDTLCAAGLRPRVLVRDLEAPRWIAGRAVEWVPGSLTDPDALARLVAGAGTVLHLAGVVRATHANEFDRGNRVGTANLLSALAAHAPAARLVMVSSLAAVGPSAHPEGLPPEADPHPISAYGRSKAAAEAVVRATGSGRWWSIVRPPAIYGPRDSDVYQFFRMARRGLVLIPSGERFITIAHVADVVRGILAAAAAEPRQTLHLGEPEPYELRRLVGILVESGKVRARVLGVPAPAVRATAVVSGALVALGAAVGPLTRDKAAELVARHWTARTAGSLAALGLSTTVSFAEGARDAWTWYRGQGWLG